MAIRVRLSGEIVCAAKTKEELGDLYIDDDIHEYLTGASGHIPLDKAPLFANIDHENNHLWHWKSFKNENKKMMFY